VQVSEHVIERVWEKARATTEQDPSEWRMDACGAWIHRGQYRNQSSEFGWQIIGTEPEAFDEIESLEPFHCRNEYDIANRRPHCHVTADRKHAAPTAHIDAPCNRSV